MSKPPAKKMGMSLYADLLEPNKTQTGGATISSAPVRYDIKADGDAEDGAKKKDASLKFQPIKRPQVQQKGNKPKLPSATSSSTHQFSSSINTITASSPAKGVIPSSTPSQQPSIQRSGFDDWVGDEDDDEYYANDYRQQQRGGGRRKRKKNKGGQQEQENTRTWDWDDIYDPSMPNSYADYKGSEEQFREIRDWKARLYYHLRDTKTKEKHGTPANGEGGRGTNLAFATPANLNFAPPSFDEDTRAPPARPTDEEDDEYYPAPATDERKISDAYDPPASFAPPPATASDDVTGEDAYMRRMRMSGMAQAQPSPPPPPQPAAAIPVDLSAPAASVKSDVDLEAKRAEAQAKIAAFKAKLMKGKQGAAPVEAPPMAPVEAAPIETKPVQPDPAEVSPPPPAPVQEEAGSTISRAPVRYDVVPPQKDELNNEDTATDEVQPKSSRPGQKGFAERLLQKYGWEKGQGLGASGEGITTALVGKMDKRKKLSDKDGGGWAQPANMGKIVGGKRRKVDNSDTNATGDGDGSAGGEEAKYGPMSEVVKFEGMLNGLDVQKEIEDNNLMQEVGDEMGKEYGVVERVFVWRKDGMGGDDAVFVKFTSKLSALRAVRGMDGAEFAGNEVKARFWGSEEFERGVYG